MNITTTSITVAYGDGIGSEIMEAVLTILREAGANIAVETIEIGERIYNMGGEYGILPSAWETLRRNKILLKSPITIPQNPAYKDINDIIYEKFDLSTDNKIISNLINIDGSEWLAGSANISDNFAIFETIHDSAPDLTGKNIANPSGIIQASIMMLNHIEQPKVAALIQNSWLQTIEEGIHTADLYSQGSSKQKVGTKEFAEAVIERLWRKPLKIKSSA